jgi:hypothetical protein
LDTFKICWFLTNSELSKNLVFEAVVFAVLHLILEDYFGEILLDLGSVQISQINVDNLNSKLTLDKSDITIFDVLFVRRFLVEIV